MTLLLVTVALAIVAGVAVLVARDRPVLADDLQEPAPMAWPPPGGVDPGDLATARFRVGLRGYRMDEVDRVLDDARAALADRDGRIVELERVVRALAPLRDAPVDGGEVGEVGEIGEIGDDAVPGGHAAGEAAHPVPDAEAAGVPAPHAGAAGAPSTSEQP